jgi:hypothetical protein
MNMRNAVLGACALALLPLGQTQAQAPSPLVGTWQLVSFEAEIQATGAREPARGNQPSGYIAFTPEGRMLVLITNEGRTPPANDQDRAALFQSMVAYAGTYRAEAGSWTTRVEVAANPALVGTDQRRSFRLDGDLLQESTDVMQWSAHPERGPVRFIITYRRVDR